MGLITNKIYICLPFEKEIDKLDWDGLSTEEYNSKTYYKIPSGGSSSDVVKKITFETLKDNVTVTLNIVSSSEARFDFAYACDLDGTSGYSNAKYKISGNNESITGEYVVPNKGSHWIYIGYRKDSSGDYYNDCGYFSIDNSDKEYVIRQPKEVYLASDKMNEITYGSKKILEHGFSNIIKWTGKRYNPKEDRYIIDIESSLGISYSYTDYKVNMWGLNRKGVAYLYDGRFNSYYDLNNLYFWKEPKCKNIRLEFSYDNNYRPVNNDVFDITYSIDLSNVDFSRISYIDELFYGWKGLNNIKLPDDFSKGKKSLKNLFSGSLNYYYRNDGNNTIKSLDMKNWDISNVTNMSDMFRGCAYLTSVDVSNWDTSNVTNMSKIFNGCNHLTSVDVSNWDTSNVTDMTYMFGSILDNYGGPHYYKEFNHINLNNINTSNVTNMSYMFCGCQKLTNIDVSRFDTSKVAYMGGVFSACTYLTSVDVSNWDTSNVTDMNRMFLNCRSLTSLDVSNWDISKVTLMDNIFYNCQKLSALDLSNWDISNININFTAFFICKELTTLIDGHESEPDVVALNGLKNSIDLHYSTKLNYESVYALFRGVATVTTTQTITLPKVMEGKLDATKVKIATDKGWTVAYE